MTGPAIPRRHRTSLTRWAIWLAAAGGQGLFLSLFLHANLWEIGVTVFVLALLNEVMDEARP